MDRIVVPQFLEIEDTVIGPITIRQFLEMLVGGLLIFIYYKVFDFSLFAVASLVTIALVAVLAFVKINGQPFHFFMLNFVSTFKSPKLKVWRKQYNPADSKAQPEIVRPTMMTYTQQRTISSSKLSELALIVDTGGVYHGEK
jgi:hypothetical protein